MKSSLKIHALFPCSRIWLVGLAAASLCLTLRAAPFDAAPFGLPLPEGNGVMWEDPREIHKVVVHFAGAAPAPEKVRLEYWGSRWPEQHLPKDREPGGGSVGWMELGNWYTYKWRAADAEAKADGNTVTFTFRPVNAKEFPKLKDYPGRIPIHAETPRGIRGAAAEDRADRGVHRFDARTAHRQPGVEIRARGEGQLRGVQRRV